MGILKDAVEVLKEAAGVVEMEAQKSDAERQDVFDTYLERASEKYVKVRTILTPEPQNLYDFFVENPLTKTRKYDIISLIIIGGER